GGEAGRAARRRRRVGDAGQLAGEGRGDRRDGGVAGAGVGDDDGVGDRVARQGGGLAVVDGDGQVGLRRQRIGVDGAVVAGDEVGHAGGDAHGRRIVQGAGRRRGDGGADDVGDAAARRQVHRLVVDGARAVGGEAGGASLGRRRVGDARQFVGE